MSPEPSADVTWDQIGPMASRDADARDGDESTLAAGETRTLPEVAEHEVQDAGEEVRRVLGRSLDEVDLLEGLDAIGDAFRVVTRSEVVQVDVRGKVGVGSPRSSWRRCHGVRTVISNCEARGQPQ